MKQKANAIRPFIGARDYNLSRRFYCDIGFEEIILSDRMSLFKKDQIGFYLQNAYVKDWIDNTMLFIEVDDADVVYQELATLNLPANYATVRLLPVRDADWGKECFLHDPSGILLHFGHFYNR